MKKKGSAFILAAVLILSLTACSQNKTDHNAPAQESGTEEAAAEADSGEAAVGGWTEESSPEVTDDVRALVERATEKLLGADYTPIAYLGSQVVAGKNHRILCKVKAVTPEAEAKYAIITVYEDLEGRAEVTEILESEAATGIPGLAGGWNDPESPVMTEEASAALSKAADKLVGAEYTPIALLGTQVVAGTNYSILCRITAVTPSAEPGYSVVIVYEDLQGNAEITDTYDFTVSE